MKDEKFKEKRNSYYRKFFFLFILINFLNSQTLKKLEEEIDLLYGKISPSIFEIKFKNFWVTGFSFEKNRVITILPEVERGEIIYFYDEKGKEYKGEIEGWDEYTHIALIKTEEDLMTGEFSKFDYNFPKLVISFSIKGKGSFLLLSIYDEKKGEIFIEETISPSFSGAPILNTEGKIIGILRGKKLTFDVLEDIDIEMLKIKHPQFLYVEPGNKDIYFKTIGYTYDYVLKRVNLIKEKGEIYEGFLGILLDYDEDKGIYIKKVLEDSPAEKGGLEEDDIIISYNDNQYENIRDFVEDVKNTPPETEVKIKIKREGEIKTLNIKIGKREKKFKIKWKNKLEDLLKEWFEK